MRPFQILPSTTSHKHEALLPTLEVFARLGMHDLDLNLNHFIERGMSVDEVRPVLAGPSSTRADCLGRLVRFL